MSNWLESVGFVGRKYSEQHYEGMEIDIRGLSRRDVSCLATGFALIIK